MEEKLVILLGNTPVTIIMVLSTVDYIITETYLFDKVRYFQILPLTLFSDHCPVIANMDIKSVNSNLKILTRNIILKLPATLNRI